MMFGNFGSNPFAMPQGALPPQNLYQQPMPRNPMPVPSEMMQPPAPQPSPFGGSGMNNFAPILAGIGAALTTGNASSYIPAFSNMYNRQQDRRALQGEEERKRAEKNKTYQYLQRTDPEAAEMFASGAMSAKDALDWSEKRKKGQEEPKHRTIKGADGFNYWLDGPNQGNRVLPNAKKAEVNGISIGPEGQLIYNAPKREADNTADFIKDQRESASSATQLKDTIKAMRAALDNAGYMGPGARVVGGFDDALEATGFSGLPGNSKARAVVQSGGMDFILRRVQDTKGAISEREMAQFEAASPGLTKTRAGNEILLDIAEKVADRQTERIQAMEKWRQQNGTIDGFEQAWAQYVNQNPIITQDMFSSQGAPVRRKYNPQTGKIE